MLRGSDWDARHGHAARLTGGTFSADEQTRHLMNIELSNAVVTPVLALLAGILILLVPRFLNYVVAVYLIVIGIVGLIPLLQR